MAAVNDTGASAGGNAIIAPSHTRFVVAVHSVVACVPAPQSMQAMQVEAAVPVWYLPGSHVTHSVSWWLVLFWYVPVLVGTQVIKAKRNQQLTLRARVSSEASCKVGEHRTTVNTAYNLNTATLTLPTSSAASAGRGCPR